MRSGRMINGLFNLAFVIWQRELMELKQVYK